MPHKGRKHAGGGGGGKGHGDKKSSGTSKSGEKKQPEATETKPTSPTSIQVSGARAGGAVPSGKTQPTSAATAKESPMKPTGAKEAQSTKPEPVKAQSTKPPDTKHGEKQKEPATPKSPTKESGPQPASATSAAKQPTSIGVAPSSQDAKSAPAKPQEEAKAKKEIKSAAAGTAALATGTAVAAGTTLAAGTALTAASSEKKEEKKSVSTAALGKLETEAKKEIKPVAAGTTAVTTAPCDTGMDAALDNLIDMLGVPEEEPPCPTFTGPEVTETNTATYIEELGKRESTIPPEYRKLLEDNNGKSAPPPKPEDVPKPMSEDDLADILSKDFGGSSPAPVQSVAQSKPEVKADVKGVLPPKAKEAPKDKGTDKVVLPPKAESTPKSKEGAKVIPPPKAEGVLKHSTGDEDLMEALSLSLTSSAAPPDEKKPKMEGAGLESALDELIGTLEVPEENVPPCPEFTGPEVTETHTATYIEELGKRDSTIPPEYRKLLENKDGSVVPPRKPEDSPQLSDAELADAFSKDFACLSKPPAQTLPPGKSKDSVDGKGAPSEEVVSQSAASAMQSAAAPTSCSTSKAPADPLDALAGTLGKRQPEPQDSKTVVDKVKEKTGEDKKKKKLGEDEETIPPDYRLKEIKDKDGKPLLPEPEAKPQSMTDTELVDLLSEGFTTSPTTALQSAPPPKKGDKKSVGAEEVISSSAACAVQSGAPLPCSSDDNIPDDLLDALSGSLGTREIDPDENKPVVDTAKEKAKSKHVDKLGERDDTIPPEYRHLLDDKGQTPPAPREEVKPEKPKDDSALLDALSKEFDFCSSAPAASETTITSQHPPKDKSGKDIITPKPVTETATKAATEKATKPFTDQAYKPLIKDDTKPADPTKAKEQSSSAKPDSRKTNKS